MHPSGEQHVLEHGPLRAVVTEVGASLRSLTDDGRDLVVPFGADEVRPVYRGAVLAPWPNRVVDGRWRLDGVGAASGVEQQLALTEPPRGHALHGLLVWERYARTGGSSTAEAAELELSARVVPQAGYPFAVEVVVAYRLDDAGLTTTVTGTGLGDDPAPWGCAAHPYLSAGTGRVDDWTAAVDASSYLEALGARMLPGEVRAVDGTPRDLRGGRPLAGVELDDALTGLAAGEDGLVRFTVVDARGTGAAVAWDPAVLPWVQVHTADRPEPELDRAGLAVEAMTCPPDAFNSGADVVRLARGESASASWTISPLRGA
ncbi:aldose 1-epimerase family protein [uncultured Pseudokineococcus sp.]|uniref:aldose 1-epimerase family protein n=1 Tax=uncultured Pseudokineococcus sp. TaxID=1642928 RepID=UPI00262ACD87|nr:aldose 1-epimerase family protein [uncultured Pseudokineococcus sp.]